MYDFISGFDLPVGLHNHRMVTSEDQKELFIVGGYDGPYGFGLTYGLNNKIFKLQCEGTDPSTCSFERIESKLFSERAGHIALPISNSFASQLCS